MDDAGQLKRYYDNLEKAFKRVKKRMESSFNNELMTEMQKIKYSISRFQMQYGNFIKAQNNNFGEFDENMFRAFLKSRRTSHDIPRTPNSQMSQPIHHQQKLLDHDYSHYNKSQQTYHTMPQKMANQQQYGSHAYGTHGNYPIQQHPSIKRPQPLQRIPYKPYHKQFPTQIIGSPHLKQNINQNVITSPFNKPCQKMKDLARPSQITQSPKALHPISPNVDPGVTKKTWPRNSPKIVEKKQIGQFTEVLGNKNISLPDESLIFNEIDPSVFINDNYKLNVTDICNRAKKSFSTDAKSELEILKKKWQLDNLELSPEVQKELFKKLNNFLTSLLSISTSIARTTSEKILERKHVEFAFLKLENKLLPDSKYVPMNQTPSKKHLKRINLLNDSPSSKN